MIRTALKPMIRTALTVMLATAIALPASAEKLSLRALSNYLNGLGTVEAEFTQTSEDGFVSEGTLVIKRPGRIRLEYAPPNDALVLGSGGQLAIFDPGSNQPPERFPVATTPLGLILEREVDLTRARMVVSHDEVDGDTVVRAQDPDHPEYGAIDLVFSPTPVLKGWVVHDSAGGSTRVQLTRMRLGGQQPDIRFNIRAEARARGVPID